MSASPRQRPRVLISHQGCVPIYRRPFYDRLARSEHVDYVVAVGDPPRGTDYIIAKPPYAFETLPIRNYELSIGGRALIWQPLALRYWSSFDAVVLGDELKYVSHAALAAISRLHHRPVVWWGFGAPPASVGAESSGPLRNPAAEAIKRAFRKIATGYLSYTQSGKEALQAEGFDSESVAVLNNTVDIDQQRRLRAAVAGESDPDIRAGFALPPGLPVLLYFGRFLPDKHVDVLIRYVQSRRSAKQPVAALIFGAGVEQDRLRKLAGEAPDIVFRTHDDLNLARALKLAVAVVIPGFVGLAITHGFAHGKAMVTRVGVHAPEIEYLRPDKNGLLLPHDETRFFAGLDALVASTDLQAKLNAGADKAAASLTMDAMAEKFDALMRRLLTQSGRL